MKQIDIQEYMCTKPFWHGYGKYGIGHFAAGETKCRRCEVYFRPEFKGNLCPICHNKLSRHRRYIRNHV